MASFLPLTFRPAVSHLLRSPSSPSAITVLRPPSCSLSNAAPDFDFNFYMLNKLESINQALDLAIPPIPHNHINNAMRYSLLGGGKRIHPMLCIAASELVGGDETLAIPPSCAIEMIHTVSLMRDDLPCADNHDIRRGQPACHLAFGESVAVLAGNNLLTLGLQHLVNLNNYSSSVSLQPAILLRAAAELARYIGADGLFAGQLLDSEFINSKTLVDIDSLEFVSLRKTGAMLQASVVIGAMIGGGSDSEVEQLRDFGRCIGLLFQVVDDILDAIEDMATYQTTYVKLLGMEKSREYADELLRKAKSQIEGFDRFKAAPLLHLANYIAYRKN